MATEDTFVREKACEPAMEWVRAGGFTRPQDAIAALEEPDWISWIAKKVDPSHPGMRSVIAHLRAEAMARLPLDLPERPLLESYILLGTREARQITWSAYRDRVGDINRAQKTAEWALVESVLESPFRMIGVLGLPTVLSAIRSRVDMNALGEAWVSKYGA